MDAHKDIHDSQNTFEYYCQRIKDSKMSERQKQLIATFVHEAQLGKNSTTRVGSRRLIANLQSFLRLHEYFKKEFDKLTEKELERFYQDLDSNRIKQRNGSPYTKSTKDELIRNLKRYLRTMWDEETYGRRAKWMREYDEIPEVPAITIEEVKRLSNSFKFLRDQTLTLFLGDSGCRIEEALNLRIKNIEKQIQPGKDEFYVVNIDGTKTKEAKRRISIPIASTLLASWLSEHPAILDKDAFLFPVTYDAYRKALRETSKKVLGYVVTPHQLRHSSATYYCQKINNPYKFVYRYGWTINSDQAKRYIDRSKLGDEAQAELDNLIKGSRIQELTEDVEKLKEENKGLEVLGNRSRVLEDETERLRNELKLTRRDLMELRLSVKGLVRNSSRGSTGVRGKAVEPI